MTDVNVFLAFGAGVLSFISPCTLPLYPVFLSYITGISVGDLRANKGIFNRQALIHTLLFLLGFSIIFVILGWSTSLVGEVYYQLRGIIRWIGAIVMIFFGLIIVGWIKLPFLMKDKKLTFRRRPAGYIGSVIIGTGFAAGWTPCMGPILMTVIGLGLTTGKGLVYMLAYVIGFAIPFIVCSFFIGRLNWINKYSFRIMQIGGFVMIVMGVILLSNKLPKLTSYLVNLFGGFTGF
ncbi:cytochrome c biogenesis CcdA family protein [Camelliibacillus cellulosilyticus]|uniref:Cytochrome c biogenesis CcdA family protein n=1 Tax=Camelliibacillus cellulosilyticus TaxID=2174486 RepID=A0ABV9GKQ0_9BACL